jgi:hypothetical protein
VRRVTLPFVMLVSLSTSACGGGISSVAEKNRTFYAYDSASKDLVDLFERPYPSNEPGRRYVQYVSPKEYVFAVYEWPDHADAPWREVIARYEGAAKAAHAELIEQRVPMATWNTQARA